MELLKQEILQEAMALQASLVENRRALHQIPELGLNLPKTTAFVKEKLSKLGLEAQEMGGGLVVNIGDPARGKTILLRGDMDALPITEEAEIGFLSKNQGLMHACGHDLHAAMLLGAAQILKAREKELQGNVKLVFQAGEETLSGAKAMVEAGVLENPKVHGAMMIHSMAGLPVKEGKILIPREGSCSMAPDEFTVHIQGKGGHSGMPQETVDPIVIAAHTVIALQNIISREVRPSEKNICTVGVLEGGKASNVIADSVRLVGCIRTCSEPTRTIMKKRVVEICQQTAQTFRGNANIEYTMECPSSFNDPALRDAGVQYAKELLGEENIEALGNYMDDDMLSGSEDFAFFSQQVPGFMCILSTGDARNGYPYFHHHPKVIFDESMLYRGSAYYAYYAMRWLEDQKQ